MYILEAIIRVDDGGVTTEALRGGDVSCTTCDPNLMKQDTGGTQNLPLPSLSHVLHAALCRTGERLEVTSMLSEVIDDRTPILGMLLPDSHSFPSITGRPHGSGPRDIGIYTHIFRAAPSAPGTCAASLAHVVLRNLKL